ncbi:MAG TPA: peptidase [Thermoplasmata archaeon]|jgi:Zn-dependent protease
MSGGPHYYTVWTPAAPPPATHPTSRTELIHVTIAFLVLTADLVIILSGRGLLEGGTLSGLVAPVSLFYVLLAVAAALTGFIAHEMAHKLVARRLGYWAEFRMWPTGLLFSIITSAGGFLFAAPGATVVDGMDPRDRRGWGQTGVAGPVSNLLFAAGFYGASLVTFRIGSDASGALLFLAMINTLFATFNLLPFGPLDGAKVFRWGAGRWAVAFAVAAAFLAISYTALYSYGSPFLGW